jgi:hypothetical protein
VTQCDGGPDSSRCYWGDVTVHTETASKPHCRGEPLKFRAKLAAAVRVESDAFQVQPVQKEVHTPYGPGHLMTETTTMILMSKL